MSVLPHVSDRYQNISSFTSTLTTTPTIIFTGTTPLAIYTTTLQTLGYDKIILSSPYGTANYTFKLPESWIVKDDIVFTIDLSYKYFSLAASGKDIPQILGDLLISLDDKPLKTVIIQEQELTNYRVQVLLPVEMINDSARLQHTIRLDFNAGFLCDIPHQADLVIYPTSTLSFHYNTHLVVPDLSVYPRPFYQRTFNFIDTVALVVPAESDISLYQTILPVVTRLGQLTGNTPGITVTTDLSATDYLNHHLMVLGSPEQNRLIATLGQLTPLPAPVNRRQLAIVGQGPAGISTGSPATYLFTITNTLSQSVTISAVNTLPPQTLQVTCRPNCRYDPQLLRVVWASQPIASGKSISLGLTVVYTSTVSNTVVENTLTLLNRLQQPLNVQTLGTRLLTQPVSATTIITATGSSPYFFTHNGLAVAETDGVLQEIISPWNSEKAILLITGLTPAAIKNAALALNVTAQFPGMSGNLALIDGVQLPPPPPVQPSIPYTVTLAQLGYEDQTVYGQVAQTVNYNFTIPLGAQLTEEAAIDLYFSHSRLINYEQSTVNVTINRKPFVSIKLSDTTADEGRLTINLAKIGINTVETNRLGIEVKLKSFDKCTLPDTKQTWLVISNQSSIKLAFQQLSTPVIDLAQFPYPFYKDSTLNTVAFVIPPEPDLNELQVMVELASLLGNYARGQAMTPQVIAANTAQQTDWGLYNIIAIGKPEHNQFLQQINNQLPQPFVPATNRIEQTLNNVTFSLPVDTELGYVQLLNSPWNKDKTIVVITGTTDKMVLSMGHIAATRYWDMKGNLTMFNGTIINTIETRGLIKNAIAKAVVAAVPQMTSTTTSVAPLTTTQLVSSETALLTSTVTPIVIDVSPVTPSWMFILVGATVIILLTTFIIAFWQFERKRK